MPGGGPSAAARQARVGIEKIDKTRGEVGKAMNTARRAESGGRQTASGAECKRLGTRRRELTDLLQPGRSK